MERGNSSEKKQRPGKQNTARIMKVGWGRGFLGGEKNASANADARTHALALFEGTRFI